MVGGTASVSPKRYYLQLHHLHHHDSLQQQLAKCLLLHFDFRMMFLLWPLFCVTFSLFDALFCVIIPQVEIILFFHSLLKSVQNAVTVKRIPFTTVNIDMQFFT